MDDGRRGDAAARDRDVAVAVARPAAPRGAGPVQAVPGEQAVAAYRNVLAARAAIRAERNAEDLVRSALAPAEYGALREANGGAPLAPLLDRAAWVRLLREVRRTNDPRLIRAQLAARLGLG